MQDIVEIARKLELEVEPEDGPELLHLMIKLSQMRSSFLWMSKEKWFLKMESITGKDAMKIVEITEKNLENYINLVDKAAAAPEKTDSKFERTSTVGMLSNSTACYREIVHERVHQFSKPLSSYFKEIA